MDRSHDCDRIVYHPAVGYVPCLGEVIAGGIVRFFADESHEADRRRNLEMQHRANAAELRDNIRRWLLLLKSGEKYEYAGVRFFLWSNLFSDHPADALRISIERGNYLNLSQAVERLAQLREEQIETERRQREGGAA